MSSAKDPGRVNKAVWVSRFLRADMRAGLRTLALRLGLKTLQDATPDAWALPDSELALRAVRVAEGLCPDFILRHSFRTYCFGAMLAARDGKKLDRELFFVAALLHDLGLSERHARDEGSFEWVSARLAHAFCLDNGVSTGRAELVHDAIALHAQPGLSDIARPEIAMVHFGAGLDLFGMRVAEAPRDALSAILNLYPRDGFKSEFGRCLHAQAEIKPQSSIAGLVALGLNGRIRETLLGSDRAH